MSISLEPNIRRGSIVRAYLPHFGETNLWPRSLLIHGFVFKKGEDSPHALMASRFSYNTEKLLKHDVMFPVAEKPVLAYLNEDNLMLRTNRVDIIPLYDEFFRPVIRQKGYISDTSFWATALKAVNAGLEGQDAQRSLFLELGPDDIVLSGQTKDSAPSIMPRAMIRASQAYDDYDLALYERAQQMMEISRADHDRFMREATLRPAFVEAEKDALKSEIIPENVLPPLQAVKLEPWWKQNPELLEKMMTEAGLTAPAGKKKKIAEPQEELADLSLLTSLFNGVEIKRSGKMVAPVPIARKTAPEKRNPPHLNRSSAPSVVQGFNDTSFQAFQLKRGNIITGSSADHEGQSEYGIVWNLYQDENENIVGVDVIPCRKENEGFESTVVICNPVNFSMDGTVAVINRLVRVATTEDFILSAPSNGKFLNPFFQKRIEEARLAYDGSFKVQGLTDIPANWVKKSIEPFSPSSWHLKTYIRLMAQEHKRLCPQPVLQPDMP